MTTLDHPETKTAAHPNATPDATAAPKAKPLPALIQRAVTDDDLCVLTFDRPESAANIFDRATLLELNEHLNFILAEPRLKGVILASAKKAIFIAGADLQSLAKCRDVAEMRALIELGQSVFNRLAALPIPTVAAIHGACVGGGYEICLACDYRVASPDKATKIGLPETQLGILPAWGGATRLPRLVGLPRALDIILGGKTLAAKPALKAGLVDELAPREYVLAVAQTRILSAGRALKRRPRPLLVALTNNPLAARLIGRRVLRQVWQKTRGHYPAIPRALEVITRGVTRSLAGSLALEREAILELGRTPACQNLIRVFFLQERAKKLMAEDKGGATRPADKPVGRIAVIGAGVMGSGIAQWTSAREIQVILRDINADLVAKGLANIAKLYEQGVRKHTFTKLEARAGLDRVFPAAAEAPLHHADLVIEAAVEKMDLKKQLFARLDELAGPQTILATNTSALSISDIASATKHPERVVGIHFFNPVHRMQLVEVVVGRQTDPEVVRRAVKFVQQIGKLPVVVKDSPGFLVNRILMPYLMEAGYLVENGARVEDIDEAMLDFGMPMGPLRLIDEVGLDVSDHVARDLAEKFSDRLTRPEVLGRMIEAGLLGRKSGRGFYVHRTNGKEPDVNPNIDTFHSGTNAANLTREELRARMVLLMVNEAARCLEEGLVQDPADVDFGMIMGTGFAPFRGGPLRYADAEGLPRLAGQMADLAARGEPRFAPCARVQTMADRNERFFHD
jgi:3-hydroxyacyl-CoA dehydrogenase/enoyl-CoA hydratase/3-hydroxybutyryl-CoA epimerase